MKNLKLLTPFAFMALFAFLFSAIPPEKGCHKINAKGKGITTSQPGPVVETEADIIGGGLLNGKTSAIFNVSETGDFTGTLDLVTKHGSIDFMVSEGFIDFSSGQFSATVVAISSSGKLAGASGYLVLEGVSDLSSGDFTEKITGEICFR